MPNRRAEAHLTNIKGLLLLAEQERGGKEEEVVCHSLNDKGEKDMNSSLSGVTGSRHDVRSVDVTGK